MQSKVREIWSIRGAQCCSWLWRWNGPWTTECSWVFEVILVMFQSYVLFWRQKSTTGCLQSYCVMSLPQASMYNKVINIEKEGPQLIGTQSYNHKELNSASNLNEPYSGSIVSPWASRKLCWHLNLSFWEAEQGNQLNPLIFWHTELLDNKFVLL